MQILHILYRHSLKPIDYPEKSQIQDLRTCEIPGNLHSTFDMLFLIPNGVIELQEKR